MAIAIGGYLAASSVAFAHARLERSVPANGAVLEHAPARVVLRFDSEVERRFSRFALRLPGGDRHALAGPAAPGTTRELVVTLGALGPGDHVLEWSVVSRDGHRVSGALRFTVKGP
jgi:methionine-rich copper-binding protein CopC